VRIVGLRWNIDTGEEEVLFEDSGSEPLKFEGVNDPLYMELVDLLNRGRRREAEKKGYKLMVRCLSRGWFRELGYCERCVLSSICPVTRPRALRWLLGKAWEARRRGERESVIVRAAEAVSELARYNSAVRAALEKAQYNTINNVE